MYINPGKVTHAEPVFTGSSKEGVDVYFEGGSKRTLTQQEWNALCEFAFNLSTRPADGEPGENAPVLSDFEATPAWAE